MRLFFHAPNIFKQTTFCVKAEHGRHRMLVHRLTDCLTIALGNNLEYTGTIFYYPSSRGLFAGVHQCLVKVVRALRSGSAKVALG